MRFSPLLIAAAMLLRATARAASNTNLSEILSELPQCAIGCILLGFTDSPTALSDPTSTCNNVTLQRSISACVQGKCNFTEQEQVGTANAQLCKGIPFESRSAAVLQVGLALGLAALAAIVLRCYSRYKIAHGLGYDDWTIVGSAAFLCGLIGLDATNALKGFGRHFWDVSPSVVVPLLKIFWVAELFYIIVITLIKTSILLFYLRIFPVRTFKILTFIVMASVVAAGVAISITIVFQCSPINGVWDRTIPSKCIHINVLAYATGGISIVQDIVIIVMPIPQLIGLQMNTRKKLSLMFMFSLGLLACMTSIIRLKYIVDFGNSTDATWDDALPAIWSMAEICVATICACLPAMRALFSIWLPAIFDLTSSPRSTHREQHKPSSYNLSSASRPTLSRLEKTGPSYNKRELDHHDEELLTQSAGRKGIKTKIWVGRGKFGGEESNSSQASLRRFDKVGKESHRNIPRSESTELFALEGPREGDDIDVLARDGGIELKKDTEIRVTDEISVRSHQLSAHELPSRTNEGYGGGRKGNGWNDGFRAPKPSSTPMTHVGSLMRDPRS